jgi:hypothetical protein
MRNAKFGSQNTVKIIFCLVYFAFCILRSAFSGLFAEVDEFQLFQLDIARVVCRQNRADV